MQNLDIKFIIEGLVRWLHVASGIMWIGHLYFFNFVNANFAPTMDGDTKKKVVPELMPRALFFFRWGAAFTWLTGVYVLMAYYYHGAVAFEAGQTWNAAIFILIAVVFLVFFLYDILTKSVLKNPKVLFWVAWIFVTLMAYAMRRAGFSFRGNTIHIGAMFGTIMAMNVWMRIWPAQQKIIRAIKNGEKPDDAWVALAGARSKHNTYMSVPLVFMMINKSQTWAAAPYALSLVILAGFGLVFWFYGFAKNNVKGF